MRPGDTALTDAERNALDLIREAAISNRLAVMRVELNGVAKAAVCEVHSVRSMEDGAEMAVYPLALLMDRATFEMMTPPTGDMLREGDSDE